MAQLWRVETKAEKRRVVASGETLSSNWIRDRRENHLDM